MTTLREQTPINGKIIGIVMKEAVRRALAAIRTEIYVFEAKGKLDYDGAEGDVVTTCDLAAQKVYLDVLRSAFPQFGIIAEEDNLRVPCTLEGLDVYFTVDAVDGTKALTRRQSKGIGTMLSLVANGKVIAAYVGDVMTQEIYGYRVADDGETVGTYRVSEYDVVEPLKIDPDRKLSSQYVLLRGRPESYTDLVKKMTNPSTVGGLFQDIQIEGGSIGITMSQLWKSEVGGVILQPSHETPWDSSPIWGISQQMGFKIYTIDSSGHIDSFAPIAPKEVCKREEELLIIHDSRVQEFKHWLG